MSGVADARIINFIKIYKENDAEWSFLHSEYNCYCKVIFYNETFVRKIMVNKTNLAVKITALVDVAPPLPQ